MKLRSLLSCPLAVAAALLSACAPQVSQAELIYGMTAVSSASTAAGINLVSFDSATPSSITTIGAFSGVVAGHSLREIDFRPANGQLYAISTDTAFNAQVYTVNLATGALTAQGASFALLGATSAIVSMDFNPAADRLRIVNSSGQNYRWNPQTSAFVQQDTSLVYDAVDPQAGITPDPRAVAYSNNFSGATQTTMYVWDYNNDTLATVGGLNGTPSPNGGLTFSVFTPGGFRTFNGGIDMDISGVTGIAYVTHDDPANAAIMGLYSINLTTGAETLIGNYGAGIFIGSISAVTIPEPASAALIGFAVAGLGLVRRRR